MARLRDLFGDPLFRRRPAGLEPTPRALALAPRVEALLAAAAEALEGSSRFDPARAERLFRVSANDYAGTLLSGPLLGILAREAPGLRLALRFDGRRSVFDAMRVGEMDLGIGRFPVVPDGFEATPLFEESYRVIARRGHPGLGAKLDLDIYLALDHLVVSFAGDLVGTVDAALARLRRQRRVVAAFPTFLNGFAAVAGSDLIATVPARLARRHARVFGLRSLLPPLALDPFAVEMVRPRALHADPGLDWLAARIGTVLGAA